MRQEDAPQEAPWTIEVWTDRNGSSPFEDWLAKLPEEAQAVVVAAVAEILAPLGMDICKTEWGKPLGGGLYEFRIRRTLESIINWGKPFDHHVSIDGGNVPMLLRIFCTFYGNRIVLLFQGYDKGRNASASRQRREISKARKYLADWRRSS